MKLTKAFWEISQQYLQCVPSNCAVNAHYIGITVFTSYLNSGLITRWRLFCVKLSLFGISAIYIQISLTGSLITYKEFSLKMQFSQNLLAAQAANYGMNSESIGTPPSNQSLQVKTVIPIPILSGPWRVYTFQSV